MREKLIPCLLKYAVAPLIHGWFASIRFRRSGDAIPSRAIIGFWHQDIFAALAFLKKDQHDHNLAALVSPSVDGDRLCDVLRSFRIRCVRGSSSQGGVKGLYNLLAEARGGCSILITPDGPKGPPRILKNGMSTLARMTGMPIVFLEFQYTRFWSLRTWDTARLPKPFSRVGVGINILTAPGHNRGTMTPAETAVHGIQAPR